ncbi:MAG: AAA family ATPase, partial [Victivallales bacterium]|nr:AAA family ATPase [Victivallales bacterium]
MIGRENERTVLEQAARSGQSEFVAVYGRRRVGKTYLIRETFNSCFTFQHSGVANANTRIQLDRFRRSLIESGHVKCPALRNWFQAFDEVKTVIEQAKEGKKILFIDEMPWMDKPNANFISALENFWNAWASARKDILLIICGSATSWMLKKVIRARGGLHNRVTVRINLMPFTLAECEKMAISLGLAASRY